MRITPTQLSFDSDGSPPSFRIETDDAYRFYAVEVATDPVLLNGAISERRTLANFFDSWLGDEHLAGRHIRREVAGEHREAAFGSDVYTLPPIVWQRLRRVRKLFCRLVVSLDGRLPRDRQAAQLQRTLFSVTDEDWNRAISIPISRSSERSPRALIVKQK